MNIKIKKISSYAIIPKKAHQDDAAFDIYVPRNTQINPGRQVVPLDIAIEMPKWYQAQIEPRSGCSSKGLEGYTYIFENPQTGDTEHSGAVRFNADVTVGKIDAGYRGNIGVIIVSNESKPFFIPAGTRVAQMTFYELPHVEGFEEVDELSMTDRGKNGFGSSGVL